MRPTTITPVSASSPVYIIQSRSIEKVFIVVVNGSVLVLVVHYISKDRGSHPCDIRNIRI